MSIDRWLNQETTEPATLPLSPDEVNKIADENFFSAAGLNWEVYQQLLPLTILANRETLFIQDTRIAHLHAIKLAILFDGKEDAIKYLKRFESRYPDSNNVIHNACSFNLPRSEKWDVKLWRGLIKNYTPSEPNDLLLRLLPYASEIEQYTVNNAEELKREIRDEVVQEHRSKFLEEYDALQKQPQTLLSYDEWKTEQLPKNSNIKKKINAEIDNHVKEKLNIPKNKALTDAQRQDFTAYKKNNKIELDQLHGKLIDSIGGEEYKKYAKTASANLKKISSDLAKYTKDQYAEAKIKESEKTINAITIDRSKQLITPKTPLAKLLIYADANYYGRGKENPRAAQLFFSHGLPESNFHMYLALKPQDDPKLIPNITLLGKDIAPEYAGYYLTKLDPADPRAALLGKLTSCCQTLGDDGETCQVHGITDPRGGFYVLCRMKSERPSDNDQVLAQCWAWRGQDGSFVIDSVESQVDFRKGNKRLMADFYFELAHQLIKENAADRVLIGNGGNTTFESPPLPVGDPLAFPVDYKGHRDSHGQFLMADKKLPLLSEIYRRTKEPFLERIKAVQLSETEMGKWKDYLETPINLKNQAQSEQNDDEEEEAEQAPVSNKLSNLLLRRVAYTQPLETNIWLIEQGADVNGRDNKSRTALHKAAQTGNLEMMEWLIQQGADINITDYSGGTALHTAALAGNLRLIEFLIAQGADIRMQDNKGEMILHKAAKTGNLELLDWLISQGEDVNATDYNGQTVLHIVADVAAKTGNLAMAKWLFDREGENVNAQLRLGDGNTMLHTAAQAGKLELVQWLITHGGANVNEINEGGATVLHISAFVKNLEMMKYLVEKEKASVNNPDDMGGPSVLHIAAHVGNLEMVKYLVERGAEVNKTNVMGGPTVLQTAIQVGNLAMVKYLIEQGAEVNVKNEYGETPLHLAVSTGNSEIVSLLVKLGADVTVKNDEGSTVLYSAATNKNWEMLKILIEEGEGDAKEKIYGSSLLHRVAESGNLEILQWLVAQGIDINVKDVNDETMLQAAIQAGQSKMAEWLIEQKADVNVISENGDTLLHVAARKNLDILKLFVGQGTDFNLKNTKGVTPLHLAVETKKLEMVKWLVEQAGADINEKNTEGETPLHIAAKYGYSDLVMCLVEQGADYNAKNREGKTALNVATKDAVKRYLSSIKDKQPAVRSVRPHSIFSSNEAKQVLETKDNELPQKKHI